MLKKGDVSISVYRHDIRFCIHMEYTLPGSISSHYSLEYFWFRYRSRGLRGMYEDILIKSISDMLSAMGFAISSDIHDFRCLESELEDGIGTSIKCNIIMDVQEEDLYVEH